MQCTNTSVNKIKICVHCQTLGDKDRKTKGSLTQQAPGVCGTLCCTAQQSSQKLPCCIHTVSVFLRTVKIWSFYECILKFTSVCQRQQAFSHFSSQTQDNCNCSSTQLLPLLVTCTENRILLVCSLSQER